jgi:hypothetical protein
MSVEELIPVAQKLAKLNQRVKLKDSTAHSDYVKTVAQYHGLIGDIKRNGTWNDSIEIMLEQIGERA